VARLHRRRARALGRRPPPQPLRLQPRELRAAQRRRRGGDAPYRTRRRTAADRARDPRRPRRRAGAGGGVRPAHSARDVPRQAVPRDLSRSLRGRREPRDGERRVRRPRRRSRRGRLDRRLAETRPLLEGALPRLSRTPRAPGTRRRTTSGTRRRAALPRTRRPHRRCLRLRRRDRRGRARRTSPTFRPA